MKERIEWLALLRGLNILLVVMFHVQLIDLSTGENHAFCPAVCRPFNAIRMPLFIFCSGGLLYLSRIRKDWRVKDLYADKFIRIGCPFLFFVTFYYFFKLALNPFVKTKVAFSVHDFLMSFCLFPGHPSAHLWFLSVLFWFMLLYPLFRWLCRQSWRVGGVFLFFCIALYFVDIDVDNNYFYLFSLHKYLVYFFFGIFFFRYDLYNRLEGLAALLLTAALFAVCTMFDVPLLTSIAGILLMIAICRQLARICPALFVSFRDYIYQIFLMSFIFQPFVELILWKKLFYNEHLFLLFYVLNILAGIYLPVWISRWAERSRIRALRVCLGLK